MELSNREWQVLQVIARNLLENSRTEDKVTWVSDTLVEEEVELLKKIAK